MNVPASVVIWVALGLLLILFIVAAAHVIQGVRFAHGDMKILVATLVFALTFVVVVGVAGLLTRGVDWNQTWDIGLTTTASDGGTQ